MKNTIILTLVAAIAILSSGCVSYPVLQGSKEIVAMRRAIARNDEAAIRSLKSGDSVRASGIEVGNWEAVMERPVLQTGAAVADGAILWGGYETVKWIADEIDESSGSGSNQDSGRDSNNIEVNGDGNDIHIGDESGGTGLTLE